MDKEKLKPKDILAEIPKDKGYQRTTEICYFTAQITPLHDPKTVLAQRYESSFQDILAVWVTIPDVYFKK